jgi:hypothetical protein
MVLAASRGGLEVQRSPALGRTQQQLALSDATPPVEDEELASSGGPALREGREFVFTMVERRVQRNYIST